MILKINYPAKFLNSLTKNIAFFLKKETKISELAKIIGDKSISNTLNKLIKNENFTKRKFITSIDNNIDKKIIFIWIDKNFSSHEIENLGAKFFDFLKNNSIEDVAIFGSSLNSKNYKLEEFIHGMQLKSYSFNIYKSSKQEKKIFKISFFQKSNDKKLKNKLNAILEGTNFTRDLVSEPGNVLTPDEYSKRLSKLKKHGLKVTIYDEKKLKKLGMNALLGVGKGSVCGSYLVTLEWKVI